MGSADVATAGPVAADAVARAAGTIAYELFCALAPGPYGGVFRIPEIFPGDHGECFCSSCTFAAILFFDLLNEKWNTGCIAK